MITVCYPAINSSIDTGYVAEQRICFPFRRLCNRSYSKKLMAGTCMLWFTGQAAIINVGCSCRIHGNCKIHLPSYVSIWALYGYAQLSGT